MTNQANLLFWNQIIENKRVIDYLRDCSDEFVTFPDDEGLNIYIREIKKENQTLDKIRMIAGTISRSIKKKNVEKVHVDEKALMITFSELNNKEVVLAFVEGWHLGSYAFDKYQKNKSGKAATLVFQDESALEQAILLGKIRAESTAFSRDLVNELPSTLNPETFPTILKDEFANTNVDVTVFQKEDLEKMEMNGLLTVNQGSKFNPSFIELRYKGDHTKPLVALIGKGVTFDSGGNNLKQGRDLSDMRMDMGGAAAVAGAMKLLAEMNAQVNVVGLIQTVENMPGRHAVLPGDVITYKNGYTVQIGNTDGEGRLIMADGLIRADELKAEYILDIATLTGSINQALGPRLAGVFGDEELVSQMQKTGSLNGDFVWPMPLVDDYENALHSNYADFSNFSSQSSAGAIVAALFLRRFVSNPKKWVHIDMAGVKSSSESGYYTGMATGFGARLLADFTVQCV